MGTKRGTLVLIKVADKVLIGQNSLSYQETVTMIEISSKTSGNYAEFVSGRISSTMSVSGIASTSKESTQAGYWELKAAVAAGASVEVTFTEYTTEDGSTPVVALATPVNSAFTSGAGTLVAGTYYYRVSAIGISGETLASTETSRVLASTGGVNVNWGAVSGAQGYKIYGRTTGAEQLLATVSADTLTFLDNGSITPSGALPTVNNTGAEKITVNAFVSNLTLEAPDNAANTFSVDLQITGAPSQATNT